eukprot:4063597-Amphidinium_carterae.2
MKLLKQSEPPCVSSASGRLDAFLQFARPTLATVPTLAGLVSMMFGFWNPAQPWQYSGGRQVEEQLRELDATTETLRVCGTARRAAVQYDAKPCISPRGLASSLCAKASCFVCHVVSLRLRSMHHRV